MLAETEKVLRNLSPKQAGALARIIKSPNGRGGFEDRGHGLGGVLSALYRNGIIQPLGKIARRRRWEVTNDLRNDIQENKREVIALLNRISSP